MSSARLTESGTVVGMSVGIIAWRHGEKNAVCFWSVMSPEIAAEIQRELSCDRRAEAFLLLQSLAYELGRILPDSVDPVAAHLE